MTNVTVAVKAMGHEQFCTSLLGSRRGEFSVRRAVRGLLEGGADGFDRFHCMAEGVTQNVERFHAAAHKALLITLVEPKEARVQEILQSLAQLRLDPIPNLELDFDRGPDALAPQPSPQSAPTDLAPLKRMTLVRIARNIPSGSTARS